MYRSTRTALAALACGGALLVLPACGDWSSAPQEPSGTIVRLEEREQAFETDCVVATDGPSCEAPESEEDCNLVVFEDTNGLEYSDCIGQTEWDKLKLGEPYTDRED
jgi:hypothetical protein